MNKSVATRRRGLAAVAVAVALVSSACGTAGGAANSSGSGGTPQFGGTLRVGIASSVTTLDPALGAANAMAITGDAIYDTLMIVPKLGDRPQPNIAKSLVSNADFTQWTMTLPTGLKFSDGTAFDAAAVKFNIDREIDPKTASTAASLLSSVKSVDAPNATTVVFNLKVPFANFAYVFAFDGSGTPGYIASPTALKTYGKDYTSHAAGVGPYMLKSWAPGQDVVLVRNPNYWNNATHRPYLDEVDIKTIQDEQTRSQALQSGQIDYMATIDPTIMKQAQSNPAVNFVQAVSSDQDSIVVNVKKAPFNDIHMREALSMALDRNAIVALTKNGLAAPAVNLFPTKDAFHDSAADPAFNLAGAKKLVADYTAKNGQAPTFTYTCRPGVNTNDVIQQQLTAAGFKVQVKVPDLQTAVADFFAGNYQATCWTMAGFLTPDQLPYRFFYSSGDLNTTGWKDPAFDTLVNQARTTGDPAQQKKLWGEADAILTQQLPWVWVTSAPIGFIWSKKVHSIDLNDPSRLRYSIADVNNVWLSK